MSDREFAIRAHHLGKCYHLYNKPGDRLKQFIFRNKLPFFREFWALKDIHFDIKKGESFGIIGRNGSGKSTLLQLLCQTLTPTTGNVEINGKVGALLELGAGFNPEFTGRENVYLNGAILGFDRHQMDALYEKIIAFADIGDFIDQPIKTYSSGMFVRLAFAVQTCVEPDILIVDEALSVGDIFFQQKCARRMQELRESGTTLIFVSHDMSLVRDLCEKAVYLKNGEMIYVGSSIEAVRRYFSEGHNDNHFETQSKDSSKTHPESISDFITAFKETALWVAPPSDKDENDKEAKLIAISIQDSADSPTMKIPMGEKLTFKVLYQSFTEKPIHITIALHNRFDHIINASSSYTNNIDVPLIKRGEYAVFELDVACMIEAGSYTFRVILSNTLEISNRGHALDESPALGPFSVTWDYENEKAPWLGMFGLPTKARIIDLNETIENNSELTTGTH